MIYHILPRSAWESARLAGEYRAPSLDSEGFLHASTRDQVTATAARFYLGQTGLALLAIDPSRLRSELRYEPVLLQGQEVRFPHIYGPLNLDAVAAVVDFPPGPDGSFALPPGLP